MSFFISRAVRQKIPRSNVKFPHATLLETDSPDVSLDELASYIRDAPESVNEVLTIIPSRIVMFGRKATSSSLAIAFDNSLFEQEIDYYHHELGLKANQQPHITVAKNIPYDRVEHRRKVIEKSLDKIPQLSLLPVRAELKADIPGRNRPRVGV